MLNRHQNELLSRLDRVLEHGVVTITQYELLLWYGQSRMSPTIWRDINDRWFEACVEHKWAPKPLFAAEDAGVWLFIWAEGLTTDDSYFSDVSKMARREVQPEKELAA